MSDTETSTGTAAAIAAAAGVIGLPLAKAGASMLEKLLGTPLRVAGGYLADEIYYWQTVRRLQMAARASTLFHEAGRPPGVVPSGFLTGLLEAAGNADSDELQDLWARLLRSASLDLQHANPAFIEVLRRLTPECARVFDRVARWQMLGDKDALDSIAADLRQFQGREDGKVVPYFSEIAVLEACGVVHYNSIVQRGQSLPAPFQDDMLDFGMTLFGELFFCALHGLDPARFGATSARTMGQNVIVKHVENDSNRVAHS